MPAIDLRVEDLSDLELRFTIDLYWQGQRLHMVWNGVRNGRFELRHMKDQVYSFHHLRKSEGA